MKAAGGIIPNVFRPVEFVGTNDLDWNVVFAGEGDSIIELKPRKAWRVGDNGQHVVSECLMTSPHEKRGVRAAGVSNQRPTQCAKMLVEGGTLGIELGRHWHTSMISLMEPIEEGIEADKRREQAFMDLATRFRTTDDTEEIKRLGGELGRFAFGE